MKWGKTTTHVQQQRRQCTVTSWQWQPNIFEEKIFARQKLTLWIKLDIKSQILAYMQIALAKSRSTMRASHHPAFMGNCLTINHTCLPCLPIRWVSPGVTPLWLLKEGHQGLETACTFRGLQCGGKIQAISKKWICLKRKNNVWGGLSRPIKILRIFWRGFWRVLLRNKECFPLFHNGCQSRMLSVT